MSTKNIPFRAEHTLPGTEPCVGCRLKARCRKVALTCKAFDHYTMTNRIVPLYREQNLRGLQAEPAEA